MTMRTRRKVVFDHDPEPDFSWLEQDMYNPSHPSYEPMYRMKADTRVSTSVDGDWYRNPDNHVVLDMVVYELGPGDEDWRVIDSLGNIDFLADSDDWGTGAYYTLSDIPKKWRYLRSLAKDAGLRYRPRRRTP